MQAALALLDESGLDGLSMRRLAEKLNIKAASLYWHVRDKSDLLELLAEEICAPIEVPSGLPWRQRLEVLGRDYRRALLAHRDAGRVLATAGAPSGPQRLRLVEIALAALLDGGFSHRDAAYAAFIMNDFVTMFVIEETRYIEIPNGDDVSEADVYANWHASLPADEYPSILAVAEHFTNANPDERFQFGMQMMLDGLEVRLTQSGAG